MDCPTCGDELATTTHEDIEMAACPRHHGLFCTYDALGAAVAARLVPASSADAADAVASELHDGDATPIDDTALRACPECGVDMVRKVYAYESGVVIDSCVEHGVWLDDDELQRIEAWVEGSEQAAAAEGLQWRGKLDAIERTMDAEAAADVAQLHMRGVGMVLGRASRWWNARDDAARHR